MSNDISASIIRGLEQAVAYASGKVDLPPEQVHIPDEIDVRQIRQRFSMTQAEFSEGFGIPLQTLRHWEQGRRTPSGVSKQFLIVLAREPEAVQRALSSD
jgi:putative transcriptional regulator